MPLKKLIALFCAAVLLLSQGTMALASQRVNKIYDVGINTDSAEGESDERIIVKYKDDTSTTTEHRVNDQFETAEAEKIDADSYVIIPEENVSTEELAEQFMSDSHVEYAEPDYEVAICSSPNDSYFETYQATVFDLMDITEAWAYSTGSSDIVIAVLDTGADFGHPDLAGQILSSGYDFVNNDSDPSDDNGHGTMCAGIIAACIDNAQGIAGATDCSILPIKVLDSSGAGYISTTILGIQYAVQAGADIISMSLGTANESAALQKAVSDAYEAGVVVIAASGNSADDVNYPAACQNAIAVGAVDSSGSRASYSCYGSELDLVAVGTDVFSTYYYNGASTYGRGSGTSFSTPYVSALAALLLSVDSSLSPDEVESLMETTAADLGESGWDQYYGYGCVDYDAALEELDGGSEDPEGDEDEGEEADTTPPVITLNGSDSVKVIVGSSYNDAGATAYDETDGDLTASIVTTGTVNTTKTGTYTITYSVSDAAGNRAEESRTVLVAANTKPVITLNGSSSVKIVVGSTYVDAGATATDAEDGDLTASIVTTGTVRTTRTGTYRITYSVTDSNGGTAKVTRTVTVKANTKPVIKRNGSSSVRIVVGTPYVDAGATATDAEDGDLTSSIVVTSTVNTEKTGTYRVTYTVTDSNGGTSKTTRTVIVKANTKPVIRLKGRTTVTVKTGSIYIDAGATATDAEDGNLTASIVTVSTVDTLVAGRYTVTYTVTDSHGATVTKTRTVVVR
ncbi:MAG TPA: DUF5011 domain-containing protein [Oscillospiraceae bacterium]|nr:DUF5011 domain-containing protein [Oscillospiraceae bacterium]